MKKRLSVGLMLVAAVGFAALPAFAAVQNVKVSGDITAMGVVRNDLDLHLNTNTGSGTAFQDKERDLLSIARVRVDADLTDNVSTSVRLLNERNWNGNSRTGTFANANIGMGANLGGVVDEKQVELDLAYVTLKEFLCSPLTLMVGRQELHFGNDWIVGDPDTNGVAMDSPLAEGDLSARKSFDAIRAKLDYNPLVLDLVYAKVAENSVMLNDDTTLYGLNAAYELNQETSLEGFFFSKVRGNDATAATNVDTGNATSFNTGATGVVKAKADIVNTLGARAVNKSVKNLVLDAQVAYQFGTYNPKFDPNARFITATDKAQTSKRRAWGAEVVATYDLKDLITKWEPSVTGAYVYLSGANREKTGNNDGYKGWDSMFENQTFGHLINAIMGFSNVHLAGASLKVRPTSDITAKLDYVSLWFAKKFVHGRVANLSGVSTAQQFSMGKESWAGNEIDLTLTYDYTEDVQLSLLGGIFTPGKAVNGYDSAVPNQITRTPATEVVGSMKVTF